MTDTITIHASFLPHDDPAASLGFHRDSDPAGNLIRIQELR